MKVRCTRGAYGVDVAAGAAGAAGVIAVGTGVPFIERSAVGVIVAVGTGVTRFTGMISF